MKIHHWSIGVGVAMIFQAASVPVLADDDAIMDVDDNAAAFTGTWPQSTNKILYYGDDYQYAFGSGSGTTTAEAVWTTARTLDVTGHYEIYARWTTAPNREETAYYRVYSGIGDITPNCSCQLNQTLNGGAWQYCCTAGLYTGDKGVVKLGNENTDTNEVVVADGVRFVRTSKDGGDIVNSSLTGTDVADGSLYDVDMGDEAGVEYVNGFSQNIAACGTSMTTFQTITLTAPTSGYVIVSADATVNHANSNWVALGIDDAPGTGRDTWTNTADRGTGGGYGPNIALSYVYSVGSGSRTFYLKCDRQNTSASGTIYVNNFRALFVPTRY